MNITALSPVSRVALVDPGDFTPPYDAELARGLSAAGCQVALIGHEAHCGASPPYQRREHFYRALRDPTLRRAPVSLQKVVKGLSHGFDMLGLERLLREFCADIVHFQWLPLPLLDRLALRRLRRRWPVVLTIHDTNPYNGDGRWLMRMGYHGLAREVDAVVVHTEAAARRLEAQGLLPATLHVVPHGLLNAGSPPAARAREKSDRLTLVQFGKIKPYKGVDVLLQALACMPPRLRARLDIRIVGKPYMDTSAFERFVADNSLAETVHFQFEFIGDDELDRLLKDADAILLPYREIDASGVAMTAIAHGLPVLASAIDGFSELFGGGGALLVAPGDPRALADALQRLAAQPDTLDALGRDMRARCAEVPSWEQIGRATLAVYGEARARRMCIGGATASLAAMKRPG